MDRTTALHRFERKSRDRICMYNRLQGQLQYNSIVLLIYYKIYQKLLDSGFELSHFFVELEVARLRKYFADTSVVSQFLFLCTQFTFKVSKKKYEFDNLPKLFQFEAQTFAATKIRSFYGTVKMQKSSHFVFWSFCPFVLASNSSCNWRTVAQFSLDCNLGALSIQDLEIDSGFTALWLLLVL